MIGFAQIAAGDPSSAGPLTNHLMNNTLGREQAILAAYYAKGLVPNPTLDVAQAIASGEISQEAGVEHLMATWDRANPMPGKAEWQQAAERLMVWEKDHWNWTGPDPLEVWEERRFQEEMRLVHRLDALSERISEGLVDATLAVVKPGVHPLVLAKLGVESDGLLSKAEINAMLVGRHSSGAKIEGKHYAKARRLPIDPKDGRIRYSTPIGSYDFTVTPHKSVSVGFAFTTGAEQGQIYNAHMEAAREAIDYLSRSLGRARIGDGGKDGYEQGHLAVLEFVHTTARRVVSIDQDGIKLDASSPGDPDLHLHALIPNVVVCESGRIGSLDTAAVHGLIFEADAYYHAQLAQKLRDAGFATEIDPHTNAARLVAVPDEISELFSKRSRSGEEIARQEAAARGEVWEEMPAAQRNARIKRATQSPDQKIKGDKDPEADVVDWKRQAKEAAGWEPKSLYLYGPPAPELAVEQRHRQAYDVALPVLAERLESKSVITQSDVRAAAAIGLVQAGITDVRDIDAVTKIMREEGVQHYGEKTPLLWGRETERRVSITTGIHESDEREFIRLAKAAGSDRSGALPTGLLNRKMAESGLDFTGSHGQQQRAAMERLADSRFGVAIGSAGSGKTAMLQPLVAGWHEQGREVFGASLAWRQADDLVSAGIDRRNVKAFSVLLGGLRDASIQMTDRSVVAVDEVGLLGTRPGLELLRLREQHGFTVVALGDSRQCQAIQAGDFLELAGRALGAEAIPVIATTVRQQTEREKQIVGLFREGRAAEALTMKRQDGSAEMVYGGHAEVVQRVAKLYADRLKETGEAPTISAPTNNDSHLIGEAVRAERRAMGMLGPDLTRVRATDGERNYILTLAAGDHVRLFKSTRAQFASGREATIGRNGSVVEVVSVTANGLSIKGTSGKVGLVTWDKLTRQDGRAHLAYGDAMTIHTAQGSTANEHIFALPAGSQAVNGNLGYTANTRHRHAAYIVTRETAERVAVSRSRPINDQREVSTDDKWANVAAAFSYQPVRDTAMAMFERVVEIRRGAVRTFHKTLTPAEQQQAAGQAPSLGHEQVQARKQNIGLAQDAPALVQRIALAARSVIGEIQQRLTPSQRNERQREHPGPSLGL